MAELFASGRLIDLILIVVVLETALLIFYRRYTGRGIPPADLLPNLCAGGFLLLALRVTLAGSGWMAAGGCLTAAGLAHLIDVHRRWRG
ncbi:hypothetical protein [uncultured Bradyrhizobium sp.]|uniref:hypothetical protein n=1 Tax=uncultured Bradyrhizobium sp. TaxID=199684 RepID=UPI0035CB1EFE